MSIPCGELIKYLFDYQRFQDDPSLMRLIEETNLRFAGNEMMPFALPDDALAALAGADAGENAVFCSICGAALCGEEALRAHIANLHPSARPWPPSAI